MKWGPQPYEGTISEICTAFDCTPEIAERQQPLLVEQIFDYRNARAAVEVFNSPDKASAFETLKSNPALTRILGEMARAQAGQTLQDDDVEEAGMAVARAHIADLEVDE